MSLYDTFFNAYAFAPDPLFVRMHDDGVLDYGSPDEWQKNYPVRAITNPPALLLNPAIEWQSDAQLLAWQTPHDWRKDLQFVAFAHEGAGDDWCWVPNFMDRALPIVYTPHDFNRAQVYAPDMESFLLRAFLDALVEFPDRADVCKIEANRRVLEPYLRPEWNQRIAQITTRQPSLTKENTKCFITKGEINALLREQLHYPHLDFRFPHMTS